MNLPEIELDQKIPEEHKEIVREYVATLERADVPAILSLEHFALMSGLKPEVIFWNLQLTASLLPDFFATESEWWLS